MKMQLVLVCTSNTAFFQPVALLNIVIVDDSYEQRVISFSFLPNFFERLTLFYSLLEMLVKMQFSLWLQCLNKVSIYLKKINYQPLGR